MNKASKVLIFSLLLTSAAIGQRDPDYDNVVVPQTRIDLRDLGYAPVDLIPDGESAITSLTVAPNGEVYGATSGTRSHLFALNPQRGYVTPLGVIPGATAVTHAVVVSAAGEVYIGTAPGGHLLRYSPASLQPPSIVIGKPLPIQDLGVAIAGESIFALAIDRKQGLIYGLTYPNAHLFQYSIPGKKFDDLGTVATVAPSGEKYEHDKMISRMLAIDEQGNVFVSGEAGAFYQFTAKTHALQKLPIRVPAVPGREPTARVDAFLVDASGPIYGGTSDGYLFRLDTQTLSVTNLGKPLNQYRIAGLVRGANGKLYGVGGDASEMARMFSYDPSTGAYELLGFIDVNRRPYFAWQAYTVGDVITDDHGTVYLGQAERISKLYLFYP
jgi:outer membrane protein assembly factor BamB